MENGQLRHLLDGSVIQDEPGGWRDFTEDIDRNLDERIIHLKYPNTLLFVGDGYFYLRQRFNTAYCTEVGYACEQFWQGAWQRICEGVIIISDITWNLSKGTADAPITDSTVGARILNNKQVSTFPLAELSKSGEEIDPVPVIPLEVFDPSAAQGTYVATARNGYDWKLCMAHMVAFITDGAVGFRSDWYDALPDDERFALVNGVNLRTGQTDARPPEYTFKDLWAFAWKADNLMAGIEQTYAGPVFRVEPDAYWYGNDSTVVLLHQEDLEQSIDTGLLYSAVSMGSQGAIKNEGIEPEYSLPFVGLRTFSEERYTLEGQCNTDNVLDLKLPFVVCSNAIEDAVVNDDDGNDDEVFVIQYDRTTGKAVKTDYLTSNGVPYLYNERFLNLNIIRRWRLPSSAVSYYSDQDAGFRAEQTYGAQGYGQLFTQGAQGTQQFDVRWRFDNDYTAPNYDGGNNYGNGTTQGNPVSGANSRYTAPVQGLYRFEAMMRIAVTSLGAQPTLFPGPFPSSPPVPRFTAVLPTIIFKHFDGLNNLLNQYVYGPAGINQLPVAGVNTTPIIAVGSYDIIRQQDIYMQATDYMEVWFQGDTWIGANAPTPILGGPIGIPIASPANDPIQVSYGIMNTCYVRTVFVATFGGDIVTGEPDDYFCTKLEFSRFIDNVGWGEHRDDFSKAIRVAHDESTVRRGYLRSASRKVATGETEWELIANRNQEHP